MVMDFSKENKKEREYYKKDFSEVKVLLSRIRQALIEGKNIKTSDLNLDGIIDYDENFSFVYITLFQEGQPFIRWGTNRKTFDLAINRDIEQLRQNKSFPNFEIKNEEKCRIMLEYLTEQIPVNINDIQISTFSDKRFEPGITGFKLNLSENTYIYPPTEKTVETSANSQIYIYPPTDGWTLSQMDLKTVLNTLLRKTPIKNQTNKISERIKILKNTPHELYIIKSKAFISYNKDVLPLYRGYKLGNYSTEEIKNIAINSTDWITENMRSDGRFLYYYDCKDNNYKDHEHPNRPENDLYYNDLRHCGGIITQIRAYQCTKDKKYLKAAKKGIDFITTITREHQTEYGTGAYVFYNQKAKLGGTGVILIAMMRYRQETNDTQYDEYIKKYTRHLISRIYSTGEMLGYFINPNVQNGKELTNMNDKERKDTFSFYYPGEAMLGLALYANHFEGDEEFKQTVIKKSKLALDWLVDQRPKIYADLFTKLPSDSWLMQAIEEWTENTEFIKDNYINFVFNDANTMIDKMYKKDDSPYLDYEGSFYYDYGNHFYLDGARSEGLIASYYLAKKAGKSDLAQKILSACRLAAKSQVHLYNCRENTYSHLNPQKSVRSIRFKATRQWVRVDSVQHVACFFFRLLFAENNQ